MGIIKLENFEERMKEAFSEMNRYDRKFCWAANPVEVQRAIKDVDTVNKFVSELSDSNVEVSGLVISSDKEVTYSLMIITDGLYINKKDLELFRNFVNALMDEKGFISIEPRADEKFSWLIDNYELIQMNY